MSKTAENMKIVVDLFMSHGFVPDGKTMEETVRVPTMDAPVFGSSGGELRTFGGRSRFALPGTNVRCTVGPRTTNVYEVVDGQARFLGHCCTSDLAYVRTILSTMPQPRSSA